MSLDQVVDGSNSDRVWNKSCYEENIHLACVHVSQRRLVAASDDKYFILILWLQVIKLIY